MSRTPRTAIIIQARLGSTRLPGKVLREIGGRTILAHVVARCKLAHGADCVVIATTERPGDDAIAKAATACGAIVFRGDETDVLSRYLGAARAVDADVIMRVTSDCPLIDPEICAAVLDLRAMRDADYAANNMPRLYPHGLDCEAFTRETLERAALEATDPYDREHVTPWLRRQPGLKRANLVGPGWPANEHRWTLDFPEDLAFLSDLFDLLPPDRIPPTQEILSLLSRNPAITARNAGRRSRPPAIDNLLAPTAVFRFDADAASGIGHAMRCNALISRLEPLGWRCYRAVRPETEAFLPGGFPPGTLITLRSDDAETQAAEIARTVGACEILVIDHYSVPIAFARAARRWAARVLYLDDLADRDMDADLIVNPTPGGSAERYAGLNDRKPVCLIGPDYALLRQQFPARRGAALQRRAETSRPRHILVAFGGTDPLDGTGLSLDVLAPRAIDRIDVVLGAGAVHLPAVERKVAALGSGVRLFTDLAEMADLMAKCDLSIGAPGTSTWERACLGLPSLLVGIAENQRANGAVSAQAGAALLSGFLTDTPRERVAAALAGDLDRVLEDPGLYRSLIERSAALCDGRGTQRIAATLVRPLALADGQELCLRLAEAGDEALLLAWQQAPETRRFALKPGIPTPSEHHAWLGAKLAADADWFFLGTIAGKQAGFLRLDWMGEDRDRPQFLVSIATAPGWYRRGVGAAFLAGARKLAPGAHFYAKVLPENAPSVALFTRAGYSLEADGHFHSRPRQGKDS